MADNTYADKMTESASKEIAMNGKEPPAANYFYRDGVSKGLDNSCLSYVEIPFIDIGLLESPCSCRQELEKLHSALSSYGCFWSINHGMTSSSLDKVRLVTKQFFALPTEEKQKYAQTAGSTEGYGIDLVAVSDDTAATRIKRLVLTVSPEHQQQPKFWPQSPANFRETLLEYTNKLQLITEVVLKTMAVSLNLEEQCFLDKYGAQPNMRARFNFYPPCSEHMKGHTDLSAITILLQDKEVEGLQILKNDQWYRVPVIPVALLIITGDQIEIMSNGLFKSLVHRVVTNTDKERISMVVLCSPDKDSDIEPLDGLLTETRPRLYKKAKNYVYACLQNFQLQGKRLLDELKI